MRFVWCPGRDSNPHSFRHYPLKIACLPISPPGPSARRYGIRCLGSNQAPAHVPFVADSGATPFCATPSSGLFLRANYLCCAESPKGLIAAHLHLVIILRVGSFAPTSQALVACALFVWCPRPDSNRHALRRGILNPLRLPISPLGQCFSGFQADFKTETKLKTRVLSLL